MKWAVFLHADSNLGKLKVIYFDNYWVAVVENGYEFSKTNMEIWLKTWRLEQVVNLQQIERKTLTSGHPY